MTGKLSDIGEFGLIEMIRRAGDGIGDDCAILPQESGLDTLVSTDMLIEGTHFILDKISPFDLGWKSAAVNISDIAAMGGRPHSAFLSLALPKDTSVSWIEEFIKGFRDISDKFGVTIRGGDTTGSKGLMCINVTILGDCPSGKALRRDTARPGDLICVTGTLGDSAAGLHAVLSDSAAGPRPLQGCFSLQVNPAKHLIERHYRPVPRVREGIVLRQTAGVHAMMDISDGIASDLLHILAESHVSAEVDTSRLPLSADLKAYSKDAGLDPIQLAATGGEDYELLFTVAPESESSITLPHTVIGRILPISPSATSEATPALSWIGNNVHALCFQHFN